MNLQRSSRSAVIFDMDGVLVDTEPIYFELNLNFLRTFQIEVSVSDFEKYVGCSARKMWMELKENYQLSQPIEDLISGETERFFEELQSEKKIDPIFGINDLLKTVICKGLLVGLASSSARKNIELILEKSMLKPFFRAVVSGEEVIRGKPAPDIFLKTAEILEISTGNFFVVEDSYNGVTGAKAAGMKVIGFQNPNSGNQDLRKSDLIVSSFSQSNIRSIVSFIEKSN